MGTPPTTVETSPGRGRQLALVVGLLVLLLAAVWFFLLRGGDDDAADVDVAAPVTSPTVEPPAPSPVKPPGQGPVETFEVFAPKDPFDPLISEATAAGGGAGGTDTGAGTGTGTGTGTGQGTGDGTTPGAGEQPGPGGGGGGGGGGATSVGGHRVRMIDVYERQGRQRAQVQVDGTVYTVDEGETFAQSFKLVSASGRCATMLFGDDQFTLCEGEEILK